MKMAPDFREQPTVMFRQIKRSVLQRVACWGLVVCWGLVAIGSLCFAVPVSTVAQQTRDPVASQHRLSHEPWESAQVDSRPHAHQELLTVTPVPESDVADLVAQSPTLGCLPKWERWVAVGTGFDADHAVQPFAAAPPLKLAGTLLSATWRSLFAQHVMLQI